MAAFCDAEGALAAVGQSPGFWLSLDDFVSAGGVAAGLAVRDLRTLGFPRDWPAVYTQNAALKSLLGKRGLLPAKKVAVAGEPTEEDWAQVPRLAYRPLQSFGNSQRAVQEAGALRVVRGFAVSERLDLAPGTAYVAERYWWVALPCGRWVDISPRPPAWKQLLLFEPCDASSADKSPSTLSAASSELMAALLQARFGEVQSPPKAGGAQTTAEAGASAASPTKATEPARKVAAPERTAAKAPSPAPAPCSNGVAAGGAKKGLDYSKFDHIEDSDDERPVPKQQAMTLPMGMPREAVSRSEYDKVWQALLRNKDLPFAPAPDLDQMWGYYKYGAMDEQALLDQACEFLGQFPVRLDAADFKAKTYTLTRKLEGEGREDEARMWSTICILRYPKDPDAYYNQGVLLAKMCDKAKFGGAPKAKLFSLDSPPTSVPTDQYCSLYARAAVGFYRRCLRVDPKQRPAYINLIGCLERNEPSGWYDQVQELAAQGVKQGVWYNRWQRPPHFVPSLVAKPWHDGEDFAMSRMLNENFDIIRGEYDAYISRLVNRKDWDDSDTTPGLGDVGNRAGALHDGGLRKSGRWREVPLFTNCTLQREYADQFPETIRILQTHCRDATGLALCGGGDVIFSVLSPGTRLRPHCGPSNSRLTCHLPIHVPKTVEQGCFIRVAAEEPRGWHEGRCLVFDDSFEHEVCYPEAKPDEPYPGDRVVLLANFWHPDFEFKNDPEWRQKSDEMMASLDVETLPQTAVAKTSP